MGATYSARIGDGGALSRAPFSKSTHTCKNDQSHEFANRESLGDQQRQRQIMRDERDGGWEGERLRANGGGYRDQAREIFTGIDGKKNEERLSGHGRMD